MSAEQPRFRRSATALANREAQVFARIALVSNQFCALSAHLGFEKSRFIRLTEAQRLIEQRQRLLELASAAETLSDERQVPTTAEIGAGMTPKVRTLTKRRDRRVIPGCDASSGIVQQPVDFPEWK